MFVQILYIVFGCLFAQQPSESSYTKAVLISNNDSALANIVHDIAQSKKAIEMYYYIFNLDNKGSIIASKLVEKAKAGVKVQLFVDQFINIKNLKYYKAMMKFAGPNLQVNLVSKKTERYFFWHELIDYCILKELDYRIQNKNDGSENWCGEFKLSDIKSVFGLITSKIFEKSKSKKIKIISSIYGSINSEYNQVKKALLKKWIQFTSSKFQNKSDLSIYNIMIKKMLIWCFNEAKDLSAGMHSKYLNIDGVILYVGGRNIANEYLSSKSDKFVFSDVDIRLDASEQHFSDVINKFKNDKKVEFANINSLSGFEEADVCLSSSSFKEYTKCINGEIHFFDDKWISKMREIDITILPIGKFELNFQTFTEKNLISEVIENEILESCSATLISPYLMPSYMIRRAIFHAVNKECDIQLVTNAWGYTDFNIVNLFGTRSLFSLSKFKSEKLNSNLIKYWSRSNLHMKLMVTNRSLFIMSSNLDLRMIENEINNFVLLKFDNTLNASHLVEILKKKGKFKIGTSSVINVYDTILKDFGLECEGAECQIFQNLIDEILQFILITENNEFRSRFSDNHSILDSYFDIL